MGICPLPPAIFPKRSRFTPVDILDPGKEYRTWSTSIFSLSAPSIPSGKLNPKFLDYLNNLKELSVRRAFSGRSIGSGRRFGPSAKSADLRKSLPLTRGGLSIIRHER
jgi:hypothetical protein